jgi:dynein heavy chain
MNLIFEPMDLAVASPATVSRCGMIYIEPHVFGWEHLVDSWRSTCLPATFGESEDMEIIMLFEWIVAPCLEESQTKLRQTCPASP